MKYGILALTMLALIPGCCMKKNSAKNNAKTSKQRSPKKKAASRKAPSARSRAQYQETMMGMGSEMDM